jgi:class 3 adenylate cyclase/tetratricopeptide (TPR) repeat protein
MRCARCRHDNPEAAKFCNQCGGALAPVAAPELRRLTVMFCDLVGSVELTSRLDPEDWHALLGAYQSAAGDAIGRHHGHVAQHLGDGLVAYFGYPVAAEDDALRAVRCALELVAAVGALPVPGSRDSLRVRVGLHTGTVVMGQVGGGAGEVLALGDTPNIAARIQAMAPANGVLLSASTRTLVEAQVRCIGIGEHQLKGLPEPMRLYQALALRRPGDEAGGAAGPSPFLGREREIGLLEERWQAARTGGGCVLLVGEPGIGKSRLARELRARARQDGGDTWTMRCSPHTANTPFAPLAQFLRQAMTATVGEESAGALSAVLAHVGAREEAMVAPLRALLGFDGPGSEASPMSAQALRERTFAAATAVLATMSAQRPTVVVLEDLHWADPSSLEWLGRILARDLPPGLLLLLIARTEFGADWQDSPRIARLLLEPCSTQEAGALVAALDAGHALAPGAVAGIVERAEGNPLFVEEFTRCALEASGEAIPPTLQEQTMARLDRLGAGRQVLQQAAVIGRHFTRRQLRAVSGLADEAIDEGLRRGVNAHMLRPTQDAGGDPSYAFRHALLRDAAYASLLRSARQASHAKVAETILADDPASARQQPEVLAHHYTEAGQAQPAMAHWLAAARLALARSACVEAAAHAGTALRLLGDPADSEPALALELELRLALAPALMAVRGVLDTEVERTYARARELCERLGNGPKLLVPLWGLWAWELMRGEIDRAQDVAAQLRSMAEAGTQPLPMLAAAATTGMTLFYQGNLKGARDACAKGLGAAQLPPSAARSARGVHDPGVMCQAFHGLACWLLGEADQAEQDAEALRARVADLPPFDAAYAWCADALLHTLANDPQGACASAERAIAIGREQAFPAWQMMGAMLHGWGRARQGDAAASLVRMRRNFEAWCASGARNLRPFFLALLADAWLAQGDAKEALRCVDRGLDEAATGERCWDPELLRLRAEALARLWEYGKAIDSARHALAAAERMEARGWRERAESSFERILREHETAT